MIVHIFHQLCQLKVVKNKHLHILLLFVQYTVQYNNHYVCVWGGGGGGVWVRGCVCGWICRRE